MKSQQANLIIAVSSLALIALFIIQLNWMMESASIKENIFQEKVKMVLARTTENLYANKEVSNKIAMGSARKEDLRFLDSLFASSMRYYNLQSEYSYAVVPRALEVPSKNALPSRGPMACYDSSLDEATTGKPFHLELSITDDKGFMLAEMGPLFAASLALILIVLGLTWRSSRSLLQEKKIAEHTTDFLNNMTHEFKTPLTNIALAGKMIAKDANMKEEKVRHYSGIILQENEKLRLQVEQILTMTAFERGEIPLSKAEVDVHELIGEAIYPMNVQIEDRKGCLKIERLAANSVVMGDRQHLVNAFCNLIDNAIKYSPGKPDLSISTYNTEKMLVVVIADKGKGIDKEQHHKVFQKFFRVPSGDVHDVKGFGIGLSYVKKIIELHNGTIELHSEINKGSTFMITIPYA